MEVYGYGANNLSSNSPIRQNHYGEKWGLDMYKILSRSKVSFNRHIDVSLNYANNMRLFEATGMGSLLLTDKKSNLNKLFEIDKEIVTYSCKEEASEKFKFLIDNPRKASEIAIAGQARTLKDHTYEVRMKELLEILKKLYVIFMERYFCTLFDKNYLIKGLTMIRSLTKNCKNSTIFVLCLDDETNTILEKININQIKTIKINEVENNELKLAKRDRTTAEYCWTLASSLHGMYFKDIKKLI